MAEKKTAKSAGGGGSLIPSSQVMLAAEQDGALGADVLKVMCHMVLSRWADRHSIHIDPVELATLFMDLGKEDARRLDVAIESINRAAKRPRPTLPAPQPINYDLPDSENARAVSETARTILKAAAATFLDRGYDVSLDEIALAAGVTKPTIYSYFKGKKELFRAVMIGVAEEMAPKLQPPSLTGDLRDELLRYAWAFRAVIVSERNILAFRAALVHLRDEPDLGRLMARKSLQRIAAALSNYFRRAMDRGLIRELDPDLLSEYFFAATAGQTRTKVLMGLEPDAPERAQAYVEQLVDVFIAGVQPAPGARKPRAKKAEA